MKKEPLFVAFSTQKGGVGKTTFTVLTASYLYYLKGYNVLVIDCDFPQHSIDELRKRDATEVDSDRYYRKLSFEFFKELKRSPYPVICCPPEEAVESARNYINSKNEAFDLVLIDFPGTVNSAGVVHAISQMDYIFVPVMADMVTMTSCLRFATIINENVVLRNAAKLQAVKMFWNRVDRREKTEIYEKYDRIINELGLEILKTTIPDSVRYKKEMAKDRREIFRSTIFPPDKKLLKGSNLEEFIAEICQIINLN